MSLHHIKTSKTSYKLNHQYINQRKLMSYWYIAFVEFWVEWLN